MHRLDDPATLYRQHFAKQALGSLRRAAAQVAFANLGAHQHPRACDAKTLSGSFVGLNLVLSCSLLSWHDRTPLTQNSADPVSPADFYKTFILELLQRNKLLLFCHLPRGQNHQHRATFQSRRLLDDSYIRQRFGNLFQVAQSNFRVCNLTSTETNTHFDFHAIL